RHAALERRREQGLRDAGIDATGIRYDVDEQRRSTMPRARRPLDGRRQLATGRCQHCLVENGVATNEADAVTAAQGRQYIASTREFDVQRKRRIEPDDRKLRQSMGPRYRDVQKRLRLIVGIVPQ